ncbi:hypothetical protein [Streptomyces sp. NPDC002156]
MLRPVTAKGPDTAGTTSRRVPFTQVHSEARCDDTAASPSPLLDNAWYSTSALTARLRVDASSLRRWRTVRPPQGPPLVSVSERVVLYSALEDEAKEWLRAIIEAAQAGLTPSLATIKLADYGEANMDLALRGPELRTLDP